MSNRIKITIQGGGGQALALVIAEAISKATNNGVYVELGRTPDLTLAKAHKALRSMMAESEEPISVDIVQVQPEPKTAPGHKSKTSSITVERAPIQYWAPGGLLEAGKFDDRDGNELLEFDLIVHPDGEEGRVVYVPDAGPYSPWMVLYKDGELLPLANQIGPGQAIRSDCKPKPQGRVG